MVEDDLAVRRLTTSVLVSLGYDALEAESGPTAVALAMRRDDIDLLVTDVIMPEMSGRIPVVEELATRGRAWDV